MKEFSLAILFFAPLVFVVVYIYRQMFTGFSIQDLKEFLFPTKYKQP